MQLSTYDPFGLMDEMMDDMNKRLAQVVNRGDVAAMPIADVFEENNRWVIHVHIAGLTEDEIAITTESGHLVVTGSRSSSDQEKSKRSYIHRESSQRLVRTFSLPKNADTAHVEAHLSDGILKIVIPFQKKRPAQKIKVKSAKKPTGNPKKKLQFKKK